MTQRENEGITDNIQQWTSGAQQQAWQYILSRTDYINDDGNHISGYFEGACRGGGRASELLVILFFFTEWQLNGNNHFEPVLEKDTNFSFKKVSFKCDYNIVFT